jgi:hypothetical protein
MWNPQAYGVVHYLDDSLLDDFSFPVKNFTRELFPISFLDWMTLKGTKIIPQINFSAWCPESILSFQHSKNIKILKNNYLETQINARNNKRQNLPIKIAKVRQCFLPP